MTSAGLNEFGSITRSNVTTNPLNLRCPSTVSNVLLNAMVLPFWKAVPFWTSSVTVPLARTGPWSPATIRGPAAMVRFWVRSRTKLFSRTDPAGPFSFQLPAWTRLTRPLNAYRPRFSPYPAAPIVNPFEVIGSKLSTLLRIWSRYCSCGLTGVGALNEIPLKLPNGEPSIEVASIMADRTPAASNWVL
jgi:hypothetical protein